MPATEGREYIMLSRASCVIGSVASELMGYGQGVIIGPHTREVFTVRRTDHQRVGRMQFLPVGCRSSSVMQSTLCSLQ